MNFLSCNIKGLGIVGKHSWVKGMVNKFGVDFLAVQETMITGLGNVIFLDYMEGMIMRLMGLKQLEDRVG